MIYSIIQKCARIAYNSQNYNLAKSLISCIRHSKNHNYWALELLSRLYYNIGQYSDCIRCLEEINSCYQINGEMIFLMARANYNLGLFIDAESSIRELEKMQYSNEKALFLLERICYRMGRYLESIEQCKLLVQSDASEKELLTRLELSAERGGLWLDVFKAAINNQNLTNSLWGQYIGAEATHSTQKIQIARFFVAEHQIDYSFHLVRELLLGDPNNRNFLAIMTLILLYRKRDYDSALPLLQRWTALDSESIIAWRRRFDAAIKIDSFMEISQSLARIRSFQPLDEITIEFVIKRLIVHKQWKNEVPFWIEALNLSFDNPWTHVANMVKEFNKGTHENALKIGMDAIMKNESNEVLISIIVNTSIGDPELVKKYCDAKLKMDPLSKAALRGRLISKMKTASLRDVKQEVVGILTLDPSLFHAHRVALDVTYHVEYDVLKAIRMCDTALKHHPNHPQLLGYLALLKSEIGDVESTTKTISIMMSQYEKTLNLYLIAAQAEHNLGGAESQINRLNDMLSLSDLHPISSMDPNNSIHPKFLLCNAPRFENHGPLISVIMTTFNWNSVIDNAIDSILNQTYNNIELIIVDDCSSDDLYSHLEQRANDDKRIKLFSLEKNKGTYVAKNHGMEQAKGEFITFMDSDDWSHPQRLEKQYMSLHDNNGAVAVVNTYFRVNADGDIVVTSGKALRLSCISLMLRAEVLQKIGFFDSLRVGADSEYMERIQTFFGYTSLIKNDTLTIISNFSDASLTGGGDFAITWRGITGPRLENRKSWQIWHSTLRKGSNLAYVEFPLRSRPYVAPNSMLAS